MGDIHDNSELSPKLDGKAPTADAALRPEESTPPKRLIGSMKGQFTVPDDIKTMFAAEIEEMFYGSRAQHKFDDIEEAAAERFR
jgi:hypothetical protein